MLYLYMDYQRCQWLDQSEYAESHRRLAWGSTVGQATAVTERLLAFVLSEMGSHWRVLSRGLTQFAFLF